MSETFRCPACGATLAVTQAGIANPWRTERNHRYALGLDYGTLAPGTTFTRREPARPPTREDVLVPAAWAGITALAIGIGSVPLAIWQRWPWWTPLAITAGAFTFSWLAFISEWRRALWRLEELSVEETDLPQGQEKDRDIVSIELQERDGRRRRYIDLPVTDGELHRVAVAVLRQGKPFSRRGLAGALSDSRYRKLQRAMLNAGLLRVNGSHNTGMVLTPAGRAVLRHYLNP